MYICICRGITDHQIRRAISEGACGNYREVRETLGVAGQCGKCACATKQIVQEALSDYQPALNAQPNRVCQAELASA